MSTTTTPSAGLRFGTSGLRGLVKEMTDREVYVNTRGFLDFLVQVGDLEPGGEVAVAEDLRKEDPSTGLSSSPRIAAAVIRAIRDAGFRPIHCGCVPTPALAYWALTAAGGPRPCIMVTGSHIPADRNGVKFYRRAGEVLKADEPAILERVREVRRRAGEYDALFDPGGMFRRAEPPEAARPDAAEAYVRRYLDLYPGERPLAGRRIVLYQHSAVGRDLLGTILRGLGAEVVPVGRSERFVAVDTEDVSPADESRLAGHVAEHGAAALVSTDGDGDRPLLVDDSGRFRRGDVVGLITAEFLGAAFAAVPISTSDVLDRHLAAKRARGEPAMEVRKTRIGSPYVIAAMNEAVALGRRGVVGWEANGGFLTATEFQVNGRPLAALPTRDAVLPLLAVLLEAERRRVPASRLFEELPPRASRSGLLDAFPTERSQSILAALRPGDTDVYEVAYEGGGVVWTGADGRPTPLPADDPRAEAAGRCRRRLEGYFSADLGFGPVTRVNYLDGVRVFFANGDIAHLRPSGNAPQFRIYAVSDDDARAVRIVETAVGEPDGLLRRMERELGQG
ncbi:MAG: phosphomannomutase [Deferrisomatales bacterium]